MLSRGRNLRAVWLRGCTRGTSTSACAGAGSMWMLGFLPLCWCQWKTSEKVKPLAHCKKTSPAMSCSSWRQHSLPCPISQLLESQALAPSFRPSGHNHRSEFLSAPSLPSLYGCSCSFFPSPDPFITVNEDICFLIRLILRDITLRV